MRDLSNIEVSLYPAKYRPGIAPAMSTIWLVDPGGAVLDGRQIDWTLEINACAKVGEEGHEEINEVMAFLAEDLADRGLRLRHAQEIADTLKERLNRMTSQLVDAKDRLQRALTGKGPGTMFGPALVRVADDGVAWLLDPEKKERGLGLHYRSLADLWRDRPELRPVEWGVDEDGEPWLIVEAMALEQEGVATESLWINPAAREAAIQTHLPIAGALP